MVIERLQAIIAQAEQLSPEEQEALATLWEEALEEREWLAIVGKPTVRAALQRMAAQARKEEAGGETEEVAGDTFV
jgi:hypothetical protein